MNMCLLMQIRTLEMEKGQRNKLSLWQMHKLSCPRWALRGSEYNYPSSCSHLSKVTRHMALNFHYPGRRESGRQDISWAPSTVLFSLLDSEQHELSESKAFCKMQILSTCSILPRQFKDVLERWAPGTDTMKEKCFPISLPVYPGGWLQSLPLSHRCDASHCIWGMPSKRSYRPCRLHYLFGKCL